MYSKVLRARWKRARRVFPGTPRRVRRYDLCSDPHANAGYPLHRDIAAFWAATVGAGTTCAGFGGDTVSYSSHVAHHLSLAGADREMGGPSQKYRLSFLRAAGHWSCPALHSWAGRCFCLTNYYIHNPGGNLPPPALTGPSGMAGEVMAPRLAYHQKYLLGHMVSYWCLVLENTVGDSSRYNLVFISPSSTLASSGPPVLPQMDFGRSSLAFIQPAIEEHNNCRPFRYAVNRSTYGLAPVQSTNTLACSDRALHPQADSPLRQHHNLRHCVVVACPGR